MVENLKYALKQEKMDLAVNLFELYDVTYVRHMDRIIESVLQCFEVSPFYLELKFFVLDKTLQHFEYKHVDRLLLCLEKYLTQVEPGESYMVTNLNPIKTSVQLLDFMGRIDGTYAITEFRINFMRDLISKHLRNILINLYYPTEIKEEVRIKDIFGVDALSYMEQMDAYTLMDTKIMDRIMKEYWNSDIDVSGKFMNNSTCYNILT